MKGNTKITCKTCGKVRTDARPDQQYCSRKCAARTRPQVKTLEKLQKECTRTSNEVKPYLSITEIEWIVCNRMFLSPSDLHRINPATGKTYNTGDISKARFMVIALAASYSNLPNLGIYLYYLKTHTIVGYAKKAISDLVVTGDRYGTIFLLAESDIKKELKSRQSGSKLILSVDDVMGLMKEGQAEYNQALSDVIELFGE
jgi:hypothetical protein